MFNHFSLQKANVNKDILIFKIDYLESQFHLHRIHLSAISVQKESFDSMVVHGFHTETETTLKAKVDMGGKGEKLPHLILCAALKPYRQVSAGRR